MSILRKLNKLSTTDRTFINNFNTATSTIVNISGGCINFPSFNLKRGHSSKKIDSPYKIVKNGTRIEDEGNKLSGEGGPNWELFAPRGNRFYLPGSLGPAWQNSSSTVLCETPLNSLVDFDGKDESNLLRFTAKQCPTLIKNNLQEIFPAPEVISNNTLTLITLRYHENFEFEKGASKFVLAAREICSRLRLNGYWADFMNPFSGKPFYSYSNGKKLYKVDERFRGLGMKVIQNKSNCFIICTDDENVFSGSIFTNAPSNENTLKSLIEEL